MGSTVTVYTAERMKAIEDSAIIDGDVVGGNLILLKHDGSAINAGSVIGPSGPEGPSGSLEPNRSSASAFDATPSVGDIAYATDNARPVGSVIPQAVTRPATPGLYEYAGPTSKWNPPWNLPWGLMSYSKLSGSWTLTEATLTPDRVATITTVANRLLKVSYGLGVYTSGAACNHVFRLKRDGVQIDWLDPFFSPTGTGFDRFAFNTLFMDTPSAGSHTYTVAAQLYTPGTGTFHCDPSISGCYLMIEDVGPAGPPS